jgi:FkbM family methyltransferase
MIIDGNGELSERFIKMQDEIKPDYAIEIGAHAAEFSLDISKRLGIRATAFEAGKDIYDTYKDSANTNLVDYVNYAISDNNGVVSFLVHDNPLDGNNSIITRQGRDTILASEVKSYKIDTYFKDIEFDNICMWIDVEGATKEVLSGSVETLKKVSSIFIETEDQEYWKDQWLTLDVIKFLNKHGFILLDSEPVYEAQQNLIFIRRENDYKTN